MHWALHFVRPDQEEDPGNVAAPWIDAKNFLDPKWPHMLGRQILCKASMGVRDFRSVQYLDQV